MKPGSERGDITIEAVVGVAALFLIFGLGLAGLRLLVADAAIDDAARSAARAASIARNGQAAAITADRRARAVLAEQQLACSSLDVNVDARDFAKSLGETGYVVATVTCVVPLADLVPGIGGLKTLRAEFRSPIDRFGARS
ncbi:hypothetical protein [Amycolatopsis sp. SID8362]|uniref:hypothetical protein n=1 Tax=Amycolatopsis sp. SID8362 TaxID=2690346 RepID=UPI00136ABF15|nr:hypothetical protein [Amycolatopsis sp. SID8362]NBH02879.1 hypothetical protein [Amycolatopsis sp. SID8362]NED39580.1 hypothetical protein [Amycolatopsis sp. SID8362]